MLSTWPRKIIVHMPPALLPLSLPLHSPMALLQESFSLNHQFIQISHLTFLPLMLHTSQPGIVIGTGEIEATVTATERKTMTTAIGIVALHGTPVADTPTQPLAPPLGITILATTALVVIVTLSIATVAAPGTVIARARATELAERAPAKAVPNHLALVHWQKVS